VSSTLYYATLLSNLQIVQRWAHAYAPAYITFGCDATVSWGGPDYEFRNNTDYPIKVTASYSGGRLTVTFYGTKLDNSYVQIVSKTLSSKGYDVVYEKTNELPAGVEQVDQTPYTGYYVKTWRNIYAGDGTLLSSTEEAVSDYNARNKIIKVGTRVDPAPAAPEEPAAPTEPTTPDNDAGAVDTGNRG
jgi:vancomycin resistance protein YoaR